MTSENFVYWLQGFLEIGDPTNLSREQLQIIRNHLDLVLEKKTPSVQRDFNNNGAGTTEGLDTLRNIVNLDGSIIKLETPISCGVGIK